MRHVTLAWVFGAAWLFLTTGAALTRYAKALGLPPFGFGLLAALPFVGALVQLPSSYFVARYGHRKRLLLVFGVIHRSLWVVIAAIPWVLPSASWWPGLLVLMALSSLCGHLMTPAVLSWFADLIPGRIRGRYFSRRNQIGQCVGLLATVAVGYVLDRADLAGGLALRRTLSVVLGLGGVLGTIDFLWLVPVPDVAHRPDPGARLWELVREPLRDRNFRHFLGYTATLTLGLGFIGQFIWLYVFDVVGFSNTRANLMLVAVPLAGSLGSFPLWGRLIDRLGCKPSLVLAGLLIVPGAAGWIFVSQESWWLGYMIVMMSVLAWPGVELANFNLLLGMSESQEGRQQGGAFVAVSSVVVAVAGVLSGLFGGFLAKHLAEWERPFLGRTLTYHGVLFLVSAGLRLTALLWLIGLEEPKGTTTRAAVRYVAVNIYSNMQQAIFMPLRRLWRRGKLVYRLGQRRRAARRARMQAGLLP